MYTSEEILNYRCPRWESWPNLGLYMDQVINILEEQVIGFYPPDQPKPVTSTMINNYVKQKIVMPSQNKKYNREHLALLYVLFLLKPVLNLTEICGGIACLTKDHSIQEGYDIFCSEIEAAVASAFGGGNSGSNISGLAGIAQTDSIRIIRAISQAFSYTMLAKLYLNSAALLD